MSSDRGLGDDVFGADGFPALDPSPDEDAWDAYLQFALEHIDGKDANGLDPALIVEIEAAVGTMLPFEVGLLLVMGVPEGTEWFRWSDDPATDLADFNAKLRNAITDDVANLDAWSESWGARPNSTEQRTAAAAAAFDAAPQLLPLHSTFAVPVAVARDETVSDANPVLQISGTQVSVAGTDLAHWLHQQFDVPLPMWPETPQRWFPFWSEL